MRPAQFSTFAYLVNLLLASRFLPISPAFSLTLSLVALIIYGGCLGVCWTWQLSFLYTLCVRGRPSGVHSAFILLYLLLISQVVRDDCVLVRWLWKNVKEKRAAFATQTQMRRAGSPSRSPSKAIKGR